MAPGVNLATAYVRIIPTVEGIQGSLGRMFGDAGDQAGGDFNRGFGQRDPGGSAGESFLGGLKGKAMLGVAGIAAAAGAAFVDAYNEAVDQRQSEAKLQGNLGLEPDAARALGKTAGQLYAKGYGESLGELTSQVGDVFSSIKGLDIMDSASIEKLTGKAISFSQAFETDVSDAVSRVNTLMGSGLVANADEAFDLLTRSSQKVPAALRADIADASDEYSQFFRTLGFSGEEAFDALVKGADKGTFGIDKTGDAIKEFTIRSTDMSASSVAAYSSIGLSAEEMSSSILAGGDTAHSAFQRIVDGILNIQDPTTQANTAIALFGTQMEDLNVADVPQFLQGLKGMSGSLGDVAGAADDMDAAMGSTTSGVELFWRNLKTNIVDFIRDEVMPRVTQFTAWLGEKLGPYLKLAAEWFSSTLVPAVKELAVWMGEHLGPIVQKVGLFFRDDLIPFLIVAYQWFEENLLPTLQRFGEFIGATFDNLMTVVGGIIDFLGGIFTGDWERVWEGIKGIFGGIWDQILNIVGLAWDVLTGIGGKILDWLSGLPGWAWERIQAFAGFLVEKGAQFLQWIWDGIVAKAQDVWAWFTSLPGQAWGYVSSQVATILGYGSAFVGWITEGITTGASDLWNWFIALPTKAWEILQNLGSLVKKIGSDFVNGIVEGIKGAAKAVWDAVTNLFNLQLNDAGTGYVGAEGYLPGFEPGVTPGGSARGGVIPGRDPGRRDNVLGRLPNGVGWGLRSEEAVMVPEFTRQAGGAPGIYRLNRLAEAGRLGELMGGFAWGGVVPKAKEIGRWASEGIANSIKVDNASTTWDHIGDDVRKSAGKSMGGADVDPGSARGRFINAMLSKQGTEYVWGAAGPNVFDCSGLVSWALEQAGVGKGRLTAEGFNSSFPRAGEAPGNLVTFDTGRIPGKAGHIGAIVDVARGLMMHTDGAGPARISDYKSRDGGPLNIVDAIGGGGVVGAVTQAFTGILSKVKGVIKGAWNNAVGPSGETAPGGSGVERWRGLGLDVLDKVGKYRGLSLTQYIDRMLMQIGTESSGDENAINTTDINAQRGDPSIGLLQVIGSTFRSALRGTPFEYLIAAGQRDPRASLTASTLYSLNRYGSLERAWRGVAYDQGGWLMPGTQGINLLNRPEAVLTPPQSQALVTHAAALEAGWWGGTPTIQIFIGDREITDIVDLRVGVAIDGASRELELART